MSLYTHGVAAANSLVGPYRIRASKFTTGALDFHRGASRFYRRGQMQVRGTITNWLVELILDIVHIGLIVGGIYLILTALA
jgi:hypothetical protein